MQIVTLAKSWREGGICFAGKDIKTKKWTRPVTELGPIPKEIAFNINLLDIVDINITRPCPNLHQQENYFFLGNNWKKIGTLKKLQLINLVDGVESIWDHKNSIGADRLYPEDIKTYGISTSLMLIKVDSSKVFLNNYRKWACNFIYKNVEYTLRITDTEANKKFKDGQILNEPFFCISLASPWHNSNTNRYECFKLIAGVIL